jgi:hypothetical protein
MKQLPHTPFITSLLKKTLGSDADTATLPVFEVIATSSRPLKKKGLYENAVITTLTLAQMAAAVNNEAIPLMMDHNMEGTPKGKFFYAEMRQDTGLSELRGYMYIDPSEADLVTKANTGTADETSVGFLPSAIRCSACSFDYMAALRAGKYEPLMTLTCDKGHKLNANGVHAMVDGLDDFMELSMVSRGAAPNSKIIGADNAKLGQHIAQLSASGFDVSELYLTASASEGRNDMDLTELVVQLSDVKAEKIGLEAQLSSSTLALTAANDRATTAEGRVTELETELTAAREAVKPTEDAEALTAAMDFLKGQFTAILTASGKTDITVPDTVAELVAGIKEHRATLTAILPVGGVAVAAGRDTEDKTDVEVDRLTAFKRKN